MFIDEVKIILQAGHGGAGKVSFYPPPMRGPDGGNGGRGGDIYIKATSDLTALSQFSGKKILSAKDGKPGGSNRKTGSDGENLVVSLPVGSVLVNTITNQEISLSDINEEILICKGGLGGKGNFEMKSSRVTTPKFAQKGLPGEEKDFKITLKLIADFGLVGLPNAGKSSLLNELTAANVKVANYPFTTLEPNLGVLNGRVFADIPGLIEGASEGKGLGFKFLRHIEKVGILLHCVSAESGNPTEDYKTVKKELGHFAKELKSKKEIIILTKKDSREIKELERIESALKKLNPNIIPVSIYDWDSIEKLKRVLNI